MFDGLKRDHHLKHTGRQQLGNFLKVSHACTFQNQLPCKIHIKTSSPTVLMALGFVSIYGGQKGPDA